MPYISTERVKEIRNEIKRTFPSKDGWKFSIVRRHYTVVSFKILAGPIELITPNQDGTYPERRYEQINEFHIDSHYKNTPEVRDALSKMYSIINKGNYIESEDGDYGSIPSFYVHMSIGDWDKPYQVINKDSQAA